MTMNNLLAFDWGVNVQQFGKVCHSMQILCNHQMDANSWNVLLYGYTHFSAELWFNCHLCNSTWWLASVYSVPPRWPGHLCQHFFGCTLFYTSGMELHNTVASWGLCPQILTLDVTKFKCSQRLLTQNVSTWHYTSDPTTEVGCDTNAHPTSYGTPTGVPEVNPLDSLGHAGWDKEDVGWSREEGFLRKPVVKGVPHLANRFDVLTECTYGVGMDMFANDLPSPPPSSNPMQEPLTPHAVTPWKSTPSHTHKNNPLRLLPASGPSIPEPPTLFQHC